jgi:hypothetical protein
MPGERIEGIHRRLVEARIRHEWHAPGYGAIDIADDQDEMRARANSSGPSRLSRSGCGEMTVCLGQRSRMSPDEIQAPTLCECGTNVKGLSSGISLGKGSRRRGHGDARCRPRWLVGELGDEIRGAVIGTGRICVVLLAWPIFVCGCMEHHARPGASATVTTTPRLVGLSWPTAAARVDGEGLCFQFGRMILGGGSRVGTVVAQSPTAGARTKRLESVTLDVRFRTPKTTKRLFLSPEYDTHRDPNCPDLLPGQLVMGP